jgi:hypothetical protein
MEVALVGGDGGTQVVEDLPGAFIAETGHVSSNHLF